MIEISFYPKPRHSTHQPQQDGMIRINPFAIAAIKEDTHSMYYTPGGGKFTIVSLIGGEEFYTDYDFETLTSEIDALLPAAARVLFGR